MSHTHGINPRTGRCPETEAAKHSAIIRRPATMQRSVRLQPDSVPGSRGLPANFQVFVGSWAFGSWVRRCRVTRIPSVSLSHQPESYTLAFMAPTELSPQGEINSVPMVEGEDHPMTAGQSRVSAKSKSRSNADRWFYVAATMLVILVNVVAPNRRSPDEQQDERGRAHHGSNMSPRREPR